MPSHPFDPKPYKHNRQYGIDEIVLLCIGKTNSAHSYLGNSERAQNSRVQVSRLEVDHDYAVIPIYNLEWYECINAKLADVDTGWGTYDNGEEDVPRVTCRPRMSVNGKFRQDLFYSVDDGTCEDKTCDDSSVSANLYTLSDGMCDGDNAGKSDTELYGILNNGLIFTIHDPAWDDKEITTVLVSARNQRKLYGDTNWDVFVDTTFDDYTKIGDNIGGAHNRGVSADSLPFNLQRNADDYQYWWRLRCIRHMFTKPHYVGSANYGNRWQEGGGTRLDKGIQYSTAFKTLISKSKGAGGVVHAQGRIDVVQEGTTGDTCTPAGDGSIEASTTRQGRAAYSEEICQPAVEGDSSCDTSTLQQGSTSLEIETSCRNVMYVTEEGNITPNPLTVDGTLSNITDVNFISASGDEEYVVTYAGMGSGMTVGQHMVSRTSRDPKDDKTVGFHVDYKDENDVIDSNTGQQKDRMFISAYDNDTTAAGALTVMRSTNPGFVGINDMAGQAELILPETIFNIQSTGDAVSRITSLNTSHKASVQLSNPDNNLREGFEIEYSQSTARADMSVFKNMGKKTVISIDNNTQRIGLHTVNPNELLTLSKIIDTATISVEEQEIDPSPTADYGKVYVKPVADNDDQTQSLYFEDDTGNVFDLIFNPSSDERMVYTDDSCNTYAGKTPERRDGITSSNNTGLGGGALYNITTQMAIPNGDHNTAVGCNAGMGCITGDDNLFLGKSAGAALVHGNENIFIGDVLSSDPRQTFNHSILIGRGNLSPDISQASVDYTFLLGATDPLLRGTLGPNHGDRHLYLYEGAPLSFQNTGKNDLLTIRPKTTVDGVKSWFEKVESVGNNYPEGTIDFLFTSKGIDGTAIMTEKKLLTLSHNAAAMTNSCSYQVSSPVRPFAELQGDLNIRGTINFCDGTSLGSSDGLIYAPGNGINSSVNTFTGTTEFNLDIEELTFSSDLSGPDTHLAVSTNNLVRKVNIDGLAAIIASGEARITECDSGAGQNHVFTNNSTIEETTCYTNFFGYRAGDKASNSEKSNFIGVEAGSHAVGVSANAVDECSHSNFIGHMAGYEVQNSDHSVFIGNAAGYKADNSRVSVFIGDSAGTSASSARSIGIGDNALESVVGQKNIELTVGMGGGDPARLIVGSQDYKINIGDCIGGDMALKRVSIGDARINPDAVLEVKALTDDVRLQEWKDYNNNVVAYIDKDGKLYVNGGVVYSA